MFYDPAQLDALRAAVSEGTFEAAARRLRVTPSAVSQRIRALENTVGRVLLSRSKPVEPTESGRVLLRLARQLDTLSGDVARELGAPDGDASGEPGSAGNDRPRVRVPIAVNADSLATWLLPALAELAGAIDFEFHREDESHTTALLRDGTVMAAVSAVAEPVQGCTSTPLGVMRYRPMASRAFAARWFPELQLRPVADLPAGGGGACPLPLPAEHPTNRRVAFGSLRRAPVVVFDLRDELQHDYLRLRAQAESAEPPVPPRHLVPASVDFVRAVAAGYGWGMVPEAQRSPDLVDLDPEVFLDVPLHWQQWQLRTATLDLVAATVATAAQSALRPPSR